NVDVSLVPPSLTQGCAVSATTLTLPAGCTPGPIPAGSVAAPAFLTVDAAPVPGAPTSVVALPRTAADGSPDVLLATVRDQGLALIDPHTLIVAARLSNLGGTAAYPAFRTNGSGLRLYVPVFSTGFLAVVDVPDPANPSTAVLTALLGELQQGIVQP